MEWEGRRQSDNVEDRRGMNKGRVAVGGGIIGIIILLINVFGSDNLKQITPLLQQVAQSQQVQTQGTQQSLSPEQIKLGHFASTVFADTEDVWGNLFKTNGGSYQQPKLVLFSGQTQSACGGASASTGPFYCPADQKVYLDLSFFEELKTRFGAKGGDFAIAYVIAHEVGHHVQTLLGTSDKVRKLQAGKSEAEINKLSVGLELQADFYAGIWAHYDQQYIQPGDIDEAMSAAQAVGDDAIQKKMSGVVRPDSFTHGTSEQRMYWFMKGYKTGDLKQGDTFKELGISSGI